LGRSLRARSRSLVHPANGIPQGDPVDRALPAVILHEIPDALVFIRGDQNVGCVRPRIHDRERRGPCGVQVFLLLCGQLDGHKTSILQRAHPIGTTSEATTAAADASRQTRAMAWWLPRSGFIGSRSMAPK